jgi:ferredoxin
LEPVGRRAAVRADQTLLDAAQQAGVESWPCAAARGACGKCRVHLIEGDLTPPTPVEERFLSARNCAPDTGWRVRCGP